MSNIYFSSQFADMDSAYWGLGFTENEVFIGLCTHNPKKSGSLFSFDRKNKEIKKILSLEDILPHKKGFLPQGKIHTPILSGSDGNMYFGTHFAYPFGRPQLIKYEGGHIVSFNPRSRMTHDLGIPIKSEGILTLALDGKNMILYGLSAPSFKFFSFDIITNKLINFGQITNKGSICRALVVDNIGDVYGSYEENNIFRYVKKTSQIERLNIKLPSSKKIIKEWNSEYRGGVNYIGRKIWRSALWHEATQKIYGVQAEESKLFSFDPKNSKIKQLISLLGKDCTNTINRIYPTLSLSNYKSKLFYVPVNGFFDYCRSENIAGYSTLVSYDIIKKKMIKHGVIMSGEHMVLGVAGSTITDDGTLYFIGAIEVLPNEEYNEFNKINGKGFNIGLIEINTNKLKYG